MSLLNVFPLAILSLASLCLPFVSLSIAETVKLSVSASSKLAATGIELGDGDTALIEASGFISYGSRGPSVCRSQVPPSGCSAETICPGPGGCGSILGKLDNGSVFLVGDSTSISGPGNLLLGVNDFDNAFGDNSGSFDVTVQITRKGKSISGKVTGIVCDANAEPEVACQTQAVSNVLVAVRQGSSTIGRKKTTSDGQYSFKLKKSGDYVVTSSMADTVGVPRQRKVKVKDSAVTGVDFNFPVPKKITIYMKNKAFRAERKAVRSGGTIEFCGQSKFPYSPYGVSAKQGGPVFQLFFSIKNPQSCKSVKVSAFNGVTTRIDLGDARHINMLSYVFVVP